jgi:hypothetical protein
LLSLGAPLSCCAYLVRIHVSHTFLTLIPLTHRCRRHTNTVPVTIEKTNANLSSPFMGLQGNLDGWKGFQVEDFLMPTPKCVHPSRSTAPRFALFRIGKTPTFLIGAWLPILSHDSCRPTCKDAQLKPRHSNPNSPDPDSQSSHTPTAIEQQPRPNHSVSAPSSSTQPPPRRNHLTDRQPLFCRGQSSCHSLNTLCLTGTTLERRRRWNAAAEGVAIEVQVGCEMIGSGELVAALLGHVEDLAL